MRRGRRVPVFLSALDGGRLRGATVLIGQKITVLGAGIAGLAAARALALRGARVTVLEQAEEIREVGAGLQISPNGAVVLEALGLGEALRARTIRGQAVALRDYRRGRVVSHLSLPTDGAGYHFAHRADLIDILAEGAREAGVKIRLLQKVSEIDLTDTCARVTTAQGAEFGASLVIGADGLHSRLRPVLNGAAEPFFTGQVAWRATVPAPADMPRVATVYMGPGRHLVCYPLRGGTMANIVAVQEQAEWRAESWTQEDDPANLRAAFSEFAPAVQDLLARVETVNQWGLFRHPVAPHWVGDRAALIGDAAHPTLPFMAQGANMALEDAWTLTSLLAQHPEDPATALRAYQAARKDRCTRIVEAASKNARNYHLTSTPVRMAAHTVLGLASRIAPKQVLGRFDWIYAKDVTRDFP